MAALPSVAVLVVNFNGGEFLTQCIQSVLASSLAVEVWVVDNHSTDGSIEWLLQQEAVVAAQSRLHLIRNSANLGFAAANNQALRLIDADFVLLLNPDCVLQIDTMQQMLTLMSQQPQVGMAGCLILNPDGSEQRGCRRQIPTPWRVVVGMTRLDRLFPNHPLFQNFTLEQLPLPSQPIAVDAISGAFMWVRREAIAAVGLLDEGYFLHGEDLDWCLRFGQLGWPIWFVPMVSILHVKGVCSRGRPLRVSWHLHRGMSRFYHKFFWPSDPWPLVAVVVVGIWLRFGLVSVLNILRLGYRR